MKKKIIRLLATGLAITLMFGITACGNEKNTEEDVSLGDIVVDDEILTPESTGNSNNNTSENNNGNTEGNKDTTTSSDSTNDTTDDSANESQNDAKDGIGPVKEEEAVIYIDDVAIKMDQTYEEFEQLMKQHNWTVGSDLGSPIIPTDENHSGSFSVKTNIGEFQVRFMENENDTAAVIRNITIYPNYIITDDMDKFNLCGITLNTSHDEIMGKLEVYSELPTGNKYLLDDWLYLSVWDTTSDGTSTIKIDRKIFTQRETE